MATNTEKLTQVGVALPAALLSFVEQSAASDDRTLSGQIRFYLLEAARRRGADLAAPAPASFPAAPTVAQTPEGIAEARSRLAEWQKEYGPLRKLLANPNGGWTVEHEQRCMRLRTDIDSLERQIALAGRMVVGEMKNG